MKVPVLLNFHLSCCLGGLNIILFQVFPQSILQQQEKRRREGGREEAAEGNGNK